MRSAKDIEHSLKHSDLDIGINARTDQMVLGELVEKHQLFTGARRAIRSTRPQHLITRVTAAAAVVVIAGLLASHPLRREYEPTSVKHATMSAAELLTVRRLNTAYHRGGMQGLARQCEEAAEMVDIRPTKVSVEDLIAEFNGHPDPERTR
jgi:hypothetical protein